MRVCGGIRQGVGVLLVLSGVLIVFLCLPMEFFLIALGGGRAAAAALEGGKSMSVKMICVKPPRFLRALLRWMTGRQRE